MKKLLIFHSTIAPYRISFFNDLYKAFDTKICLRYKNLRSQQFDYERISSQFCFSPIYLKELFQWKGRTFNSGYWKVLNAFRPNVVFVEEFSIGAIFVLLHRFFTRGNYKIVSICDDSYNMVADNNDFSQFHKWSRKIIAPLIDEIILVEPKVQKWYQDKYQKGVWFPIIKPDNKAREEYTRTIDLSNQILKDKHLENKCVFLYVGRLVKIKNVDIIIRAFSQLDQNRNILIIVGDGPESILLKELAKKLSVNILFTGRLEGDDLNVWYNIAHCFVLASYQEPFGAVTNEALLAGCIALVSNKAGSSCLVKNGKNGYTFDPMVSKELTMLMQNISSSISVVYPIKLKNNMMLYKYEDFMKSLINHIEKL